MLDRLRVDCNYYLGNGGRHPNCLWAGNEDKQIAEMKRLYNMLIVKPEWISMADIKRYERDMMPEV